MEGQTRVGTRLRKRWIRLTLAALLLVAISVSPAYSVIQGQFPYAYSGRSTVMAAYANDFSTWPYTPTAAAFDGNSIWVTGDCTGTCGTGSVATDANVTRITNGSVEKFPLPNGSRPAAIAFDGDYMWTANRGTSSVSKLSLAGTVLGTYSLGVGFGTAALGTAAIAWNPFDRSIWAINSSTSTITTVLFNGAIRSTISLPAGSAPNAVASDGVYMWVSNPGTKTVTKVSSGCCPAVTIPLTYEPRSIAFDGTYIWTANSNGTVTKISPLTNAVVGSYTVAAASNNVQGPLGIAFDQPGYTQSGQIDPNTYMWVANYALNTVAKFNTTSAVLVATYPVAYEPIAVLFDGTNIWVTHKKSLTTARIRVR